MEMDMLESFDSTNNNDENENKETIQKILQEFERNYNLKVDSAECSPGSQIGDNYMSVVKRVKIIGRLANDSGKYINQYFINKKKKKKKMKKKFITKKKNNYTMSHTYISITTRCII